MLGQRSKVRGSCCVSAIGALFATWIVLGLENELFLTEIVKALDLSPEHLDCLVHLLLIDLMLVKMELVLMVFESTAKCLDLFLADVAWPDR